MSTPKSFRALAQEMEHTQWKTMDGPYVCTPNCFRCRLERLCAEWEQEIADQRGDLGQVYIQQLLLGKEKP